MPLDWQTVHVPIAGGLDTEGNPQARRAGGLDIARNVEAERPGGLQTRHPFASTATGTDIRRVFSHGGELIVFTKDTVYSYNAQAGTLVSRGTHLAVKVEEQARFVNTADQVACQRAELNGVVVIAWCEKGASNDQVYWAAYDKTTGAIIRDRGPTATATRPRLVVTTNRIILFFEGTPNLLAQAFDPANLPTTMSTTTVYSAANGYSSGIYDVVASGTTCYLVSTRTVNTSYEIMTISEALSVSRVTKARTADAGLAIALAPNGTHLTVARSNGAATQADYLSLAGPFTDVTVNQAIFAAASSSIAAAYRSTQDSSQYRCYIFGGSSVNYVDTGGTIGSSATHVVNAAVASRAFNHDGRVYVWRVFAETSGFSGAGVSGLRAALQNTYFLYRDDGFLVAKSATHRAAGAVEYTGMLPHVQSLGSGVFAWCGGDRRVIPIGQKQRGYSDRGPREVLFTFDSNEARRCARLGQTLYISGGEILQYDGVGLYEAGFHIYPWYFGAIEAANASAIEDGSYTLKVTWRWDNAKGERDRSTTATHGTVEITAAPASSIELTTWKSLPVTHKTASPPAVEVWRTLKDPVSDAPFYLVTSQDPAVLTGDNCYVPNTYQTAALTAFVDGLADSTVATKEASDEVGDVLERLAPPPASIIVSTQDRLFLAGISDNPYAVWYSRLRGDSEVASFHDTLVVEVPPTGGPITGLAFLNETLVAFCETAIFALGGDGFGNDGKGNNYGPARLLSSDVGAVNHESIALTPLGLVFKSSKGWQLLNGGWQVQYIGGKAADFDDATVAAVHVMEATHQVRIVLTNSAVLVWDYKANEWFEWTEDDAIGAVVWGGTYHLVTSTAVRAEQTSYATVDYAVDVELPWLDLGDRQGYRRVREFLLTGEVRSACRVRVRVAYDYESDGAGGWNWVDDKYFTVTPLVVGGPLQVKHGPKYPKGQAIKIRLTLYHATLDQPPAGEGVKFTGITFSVGMKRGPFKGLPAAQKQ